MFFRIPISYSIAHWNIKVIQPTYAQQKKLDAQRQYVVIGALALLVV